MFSTEISPLAKPFLQSEYLLIEIAYEWYLCFVRIDNPFPNLLNVVLLNSL
jgi:hypothetical protein